MSDRNEHEIGATDREVDGDHRSGAGTDDDRRWDPQGLEDRCCVGGVNGDEAW
jgi:hypothetical protein